MKEKIKNLSTTFIGIAIFIGVILLIFILIYGGLWLSKTLYPWLVLISEITFIVGLLILLPLGIFKKTKDLSATGLLISSYIIGATTWVWSFLIAYILWGFVGLLTGLFIGGIGVIPIAVIASIFHGEWSVVGKLILLLIVTFGFRSLSFYIATKSENKEFYENS